MLSRLRHPNIVQYYGSETVFIESLTLLMISLSESAYINRDFHVCTSQLL